MVKVRVVEGVTLDISLPLFDRLLHDGGIVWKYGMWEITDELFPVI